MGQAPFCYQVKTTGGSPWRFTLAGVWYNRKKRERPSRGYSLLNYKNGDNVFNRKSSFWRVFCLQRLEPFYPQREDGELRGVKGRAGGENNGFDYGIVVVSGRGGSVIGNLCESGALGAGCIFGADNVLDARVLDGNGGADADGRAG